ncbi:MAG: hypothetical protein H0V30_14765 [Chitinophagaceae bacterium]|nr:hypothetical protein [Chitinophagaceae bacterium]
MKKQFSHESSISGGEPKEKKIVNEQEQNKPVNTGGQPFEEGDPAMKENVKKEESENSSASKSADEIINKSDDEILNKDPGIHPE